MKGSFGLIINHNEIIQSKFKLTVKICNEEFICKSISSFDTKQSSDPNIDHLFYQLNGNLNQLGNNVNYYKLLLLIEYQQANDGSLKNFKFEIRDFQLNDACYSNSQCLNDGECVSEDYNVNIKGFKCICKYGFEDKSYCKEKDFCKGDVSF